MSKSKLLPCGRTKADLAKDLKRLEMLVEVTKAAMEGVEVEFKHALSDWHPDISFDPFLSGMDYRVKPTRKKGEKS